MLRRWLPFINWDIAGQPMNWVIITLMVLMAGLALSLFAQHTAESEGS